MAMDNAMMVAPSGVLAVEGGIDWAVMEEVVTKGNLSKLTPRQRTIYYRQACESLGFNPLTRPFEYIEFWGGKDKGMVGTLYATRNATDQLRRMHNVTVEIVSKEVEGGILTVHVRATMGSRTEEEIGSLFIEGLTGQDLANAHMKTMTKAKRRVTLAICGLSFMDETEAETLPRARFLTDEDLAQRETAQARRITSGPVEPPPLQRASPHHITTLESLSAQGFDVSEAMAALGAGALEDISADQAVFLIQQGRVAIRKAAARQREPEVAPTPEEVFSAAGDAKDLTRLWTVATNTGYNHEGVHELIARLYPEARDEQGTITSKLLTVGQMHHLINVMESSQDDEGPDRLAGAKAMGAFWATVKPAGWTTDAVAKEAVAAWPALAGPAGTLDGTKVTVGQLATLKRLIAGEVALRYDAGGEAYFSDTVLDSGGA